jgi:hypothetical protein
MSKYGVVSMGIIRVVELFPESPDEHLVSIGPGSDFLWR